MEIVIDLTRLYEIGNQGILTTFWYLFSNGLWIFFIFIFIYGFYINWLLNQQRRWFQSHKFILLAIDIPKDTEQTPKAVEQLFATISGAHDILNAKEIFFKGMFQLSFSFEIVSIDGYVQFLIRTPSQFRDLIESSIYAQYPDAEITEVEDYVHTVPDKYPNDTHNVWGTEFALVKNQALPIRTYPFFEDNVSGEFKDPLASVLETMSKIQMGEQVWIQILIQPSHVDWVEDCTKLAYKIAGKKWKGKDVNRPTKFIDWIAQSIDNIGEVILPLWQKVEENKRDEIPSMMLHLTPGEREMIEAIERKASKIGFICKIRLVYISPLEQYNASRVVSAVFGAYKQFSTLDLNSFKPDSRTKTKINYFLINYRKNLRRENIIRGYKDRTGMRGHAKYILNIEELASLWHFPSKFIHTPLLQKTEVKKSEAPTALPIGGDEFGDKETRTEILRQQLTKEDQMVDIDLDNGYFEEKFAKNKDKINPPINHKGEPPANLPTN